MKQLRRSMGGQALRRRQTHRQSGVRGGPATSKEMLGKATSAENARSHPDTPKQLKEMNSPQLFSRRGAPRNAPAKVTFVILVVALRAERCVLPLRPLLGWHIVNCETEIAEPTCFDSAIHARATE